MGREEIVARILEDARAEAAEKEAAAQARAEAVVRAAEETAERERAQAEADAQARAEGILEGKRAAARLDSGKARLAERRKVLDAIYKRALDNLLALEKKSALLLAERLLREYAEEGDEIVFSENYAYAEEAANLPAVKEFGLRVSPNREKLSGGFVLRGLRADKDCSYAALLAADREEHQTELAAALFRNR